MSFVCVLAIACQSSAEPPRAESPSTETTEAPTEAPTAVAATEAQPQARRCLPVVHGCGCAYRCGDGFQQADGSWGITNPLADSMLDAVELQHWVFDDAGRGHHPSSDNPVPGSIPVFYDRTPCGGECIPTTTYLSCETDNGCTD